ERPQEAPAGGVQQVKLAVRGAGGEQPAVGAERQAEAIVMPRQRVGGQYPAGGGVPDLYSAVMTDGGEPPTVGAEHDPEDGMGVPLQAAQLGRVPAGVARGGVPD